VTGVGPSSPKRQATMAIVTLEDLQGTIEVVVFPRRSRPPAAVARRRDPARRPDGSTTRARRSPAGRSRRRLGSRPRLAGRRRSPGTWPPGIAGEGQRAPAAGGGRSRGPARVGVPAGRWAARSAAAASSPRPSSRHRPSGRSTSPARRPRRIGWRRCRRSSPPSRSRRMSRSHGGGRAGRRSR
jgi:hypothetical protein